MIFLIFLLFFGNCLNGYYIDESRLRRTDRVMLTLSRERLQQLDDNCSDKYFLCEYYNIFDKYYVCRSGWKI